jgi:hypothetical protein
MGEVAQEKYALKHKGFGKYEIVGTDIVCESREQAEAKRQELLAADQLNQEIGDVVPEGFKVHDRVLIYRNSIMELPMNEPYLPDGSFSPYYDRQYVWGWARKDALDISTKQAKGYRLVSKEELDEAIEAGKVPEHYRTFLHPDGTYLLYGDAVLMRMPRVLWRQRQAEKDQRALSRIKKLDERNRAAIEDAGVPTVKSPIGNELTIRM